MVVKLMEVHDYSVALGLLVPSQASWVAEVIAEHAACRQRMVYKAIWLELQDTVHAVDAMITKTPDEAAK
jgi:acid stress-induced BolA-like protein IbaG/YrbA